VAEFRRLAVHFPQLEPRARSVALLVAQGYDAGAIAGDLQLKRFDVYQLLEAATTRLRQAEAANPTPEPVLPPLRPLDTSSFSAPIVVEKEEQAQAPRAPRPCRVCGATDHDGRRHRFDGKRAADIRPIPPIQSRAHDEEPETTEEDAETSTQNIPPRRTRAIDTKSGSFVQVGRRRIVHCGRCGQPGHRVSTCQLDDSDLAAARVQDIAAACVRLRLTPAAPAPEIPVKALEPEPAPSMLPTWDPADLDAIVAMMPDIPEPPPPVAPPPIEQPERIPNLTDLGERPRAATIRSPHRLTIVERRAGEQLQAPDDIEMPRIREECQKDPGRPCPWVRCKAHLYLDVNEESGAIKLNFPHLEVWEMRETCSNDVADRGEHTLEQVGTLINLTRERVRQIEQHAGQNRKAQRIAAETELVEADHLSPLGAVIGT
jgi:hypothetical protein